MKLHQLSLFLENKPGHLQKACQMLANANINVETMALADTEQFGILRILVKNWQLAQELLQKQGVLVKETEVIAVQVEDRPGGLAGLLSAFTNIEINIEYMYGFNTHQSGKAVIVLRFDDPDKAVDVLKQHDIHILEADELFV